MKPSEVSKEYLTEALLILMKSKKYSSITVKDIAEKAGVSRLTFYRNFETKEQILTKHIERGFLEYMNSLDRLEKLDLKGALDLCFDFWGKRSNEITAFVEQDMAHILIQPFDNCMVEMLNRIGIVSDFTRTQKQFLSGGMFLAMISWIRSGKRTPPEEITKEILQMFSDEFLYS